MSEASGFNPKYANAFHGCGLACGWNGEHDTAIVGILLTLLFGSSFLVK